MMRDPFVGAVRADPFRVGDRITLPDVAITVAEASADGAPTQLVFAFTDTLDRDDLALVVWREGRYRPFQLPALGASVSLEAIDFTQALAGK
jgi:hypothetical protein